MELPVREDQETVLQTGKKPEKTRKSIVSGNDLPTAEMVRFVLGPDGAVVPDVSGRLPGRGAWVELDDQKIRLAVTRSAFQRAFKKSVTVSGGLEDQVETLLRARALGRLGLARRSGALAIGYDQVVAALKDKNVELLITASDAAADGAEKLGRKAKGVEIVRIFSSDEISGAIGRDDIRHVVVLGRKGSADFGRDILRFVRFIASKVETTRNGASN